MADQPTVPPQPLDPNLERERVTPELESRLGVTLRDLSALLALEGVKGFGPQKFKQLYEAGIQPEALLADPSLLPLEGKMGDRLRDALSQLAPEQRELSERRAVRQMVRAEEFQAAILTYRHPLYPTLAYASNNPVPVLYAVGNAELLRDPLAVACVGSRDIAEPYSDRHREFASKASSQGFVVVSGFALGADTVGHRAAFESGGKTMLVMPCGLDRPFPPENKDLWAELMHYGNAVAVSEFPFGTAASELTLRKRNKLIVALARGVLVSQSSVTGGAMNAYRFGLDQRKPVATFTPDADARTSGNEKIQVGDKADGVEQRELGAETKPRRQATVFPADRAAPEEWAEWLNTLASSI